MKILFDLFPIILFFATYKFSSHGQPTAGCLSSPDVTLPLTQEPILLATGVAILATVGQVLWLVTRRQKVDSMLWLSLVIIVTFGGATLYFRNPAFIQWKPTILYWTFGSALILSSGIFKKNLIRQMLESQISLPEELWAKLNFAWSGFFVALGFANLAAMRTLPCDSWVSFKLYGLTGLMLLFVVGQSLVLAQYMKEGDI